MSTATHEPEVYVALAERGLNNLQIADRLNVSEASVRRGLRKAGWRRTLKPNPVDTDDFLDQPIRHYGPVAVTADWHVPLVDFNYASRFLQHAEEEGHAHLVIAGDFFNMDSLSSFDYKQQSANLETEQRDAVAIMRQLVNQFEKIYYLWGNHDARLWKALDYKLPFKNTMRWAFGELGEEALEKIEFTNLDHMWVNDNIYISHPKNYTSQPLSTARKLAAKVQAHVITAHSHHAAMGYDVSGKFVCVEAGGLFDKKRTAYLQRTTTYPEWKQGYCFIDREGNISMHTPEWTMR